jgi:DNA adenine methylase/adenine-specific DNA-methyltransferase
VLSYGSNAALGVDELEALLRRHKRRVRRVEIPHFYGFGTHAAARRRAATEYVLVAP